MSYSDYKLIYINNKIFNYYIKGNNNFAKNKKAKDPYVSTSINYLIINEQKLLRVRV